MMIDKKAPVIDEAKRTADPTGSAKRTAARVRRTLEHFNEALTEARLAGMVVTLEVFGSGSTDWGTVSEITEMRVAAKDGIVAKVTL